MFHKISLIGNLGKNPEMRYTPSGKAVTSFSVATTNQYTKEGGEQVKETTWFRVSVWGKMAEACNTYLLKGSKVFVEGRLVSDPATGSPRTFTRQDGTTGASFEINADTVKFLSSKGDAEVQSDQVDDQEVPF